MDVCISVLMPAYQAQAFINRAVRSLYAQTFPNWELLLVADDELDYQALLAAEGLDSGRIRYLRTPTPASGPNVARNIALAQARGRYIAPLDADDYYYPERLQTLLPLAQLFGVAADNVDVVDHETGGLLYRPFELCRQVKTQPFSSVFELSTPLLLLFDRRLLSSNWNEQVKLGEDTLFNLRIIEAAGQLMLHHWPMHAYAVRADSICHSEGAAQRADAAYRYCLEQIDSHGLGFKTPGFQHSVKAMLQRKQRLNARYLAICDQGFQGNFQQFCQQNSVSAGL